MQQQVRIGVLSNTVSKANKVHNVHRTLDDIVQELGACDFVTHVCVGQAEIPDPCFEQLVELYAPAVKQLVEDNTVNVLAIDGGDGTAHIVYSVLMHLYKDTQEKIPAVVHMRGGTINYIADSTDVPKRWPWKWIPHQLKQIPYLGKYISKCLPFKTEHAPEYVLNRLIKVCKNMTVSQLHENHSIHYRLLKVDDNLENKVGTKKYGLLTAFGAPYNFLEIYYEQSTGKPGPYKALKIIANGISCALLSPVNKRAREYVDSIVHKLKATVSVDREQLPHNEYTGIVPTSKDIKLKLTPLTLRVSKGIDDMYANERYYSIRAFGANVNIPKLLWNFAKIVLPGFNVHDNEEVHNRQAIEIVITPEHGKTIGYSVEGNLYQTANPVRITPSETMMPFFRF